jgi:hypothetical protein
MGCGSRGKGETELAELGGAGTAGSPAEVAAAVEGLEEECGRLEVRSLAPGQVVAAQALA